VSPVGELTESHIISCWRQAAAHRHEHHWCWTGSRNCSIAVRLWFLRNDLQLNADKSEVVILGTAPQLWSAANIRKVEVTDRRLQVVLKPKSLSVKIDSHPICENGHLPYWNYILLVSIWPTDRHGYMACCINI